MPFLALEPTSRESRLAEAAARWDALLTARPDLEPAVALQRQLIGLVVELAQTIEHGRLPRLSLPLDPSNERSGRWHGQKLECGIHIQQLTADSSQLSATSSEPKAEN